MLKWKLWEGSGEDWDAMLANYPDYCVYQSFGWGEHKGKLGWTPVRLIANRAGKSVAMAQVLVRSFPFGVTFSWVPGGPVGSPEDWSASFIEAQKSVLGVRYLYCRINSLAEISEISRHNLISTGWTRPSYPLLSGKSVLLDMVLPEMNWLASINSKHRYYVKKSSASSICWVHGETNQLQKDFASLTRQLIEFKKVAPRETDVDFLDRLQRCLPYSTHILVGYLDGQPVAGCLTLRQHAKAYYATAATIGLGRDLSASYSMVANLRSFMRKIGVTHFDFGGINPMAESARGVDHFKRGFSSREIEYVGEWDFATAPFLRHAANYLIKLRSASMS